MSGESFVAVLVFASLALSLVIPPMLLHFLACAVWNVTAPLSAKEPWYVRLAEWMYFWPHERKVKSPKRGASPFRIDPDVKVFYPKQNPKSPDDYVATCPHGSMAIGSRTEAGTGFFCLDVEEYGLGMMHHVWPIAYLDVTTRMAAASR